MKDKNPHWLMVLFLLFFFCANANAAGVRIAAASSLQFALDEVIASYQQNTGQQAPEVVYGSSGNLYRQIVQGAPYDLFFSARGELVNRLAEARISDNSGNVFGTGRLVLLASDEGAELNELLHVLQQVLSRKQKLAIANPAHAPYGRAAIDVLESLDLWQTMQSTIVNGEQVSQATRFVVTGAAPYGLVSLSLALSPAIAAKTRYLLIDESLHEPIELRMVALGKEQTRDSEIARFYNYVSNSTEVDEVFSRYGLR